MTVVEKFVRDSARFQRLEQLRVGGACTVQVLCLLRTGRTFVISRSMLKA
jgi:hypothetical protein